MMEPTRVQLSRRKGWRMPENTVKVSRPGPFGNPWTIASAREAGYTGSEEAIGNWCKSLYAEWLTGDPKSITRMLLNSDKLRNRILEGLPSLAGKNLACWCKPGAPCHADVLLELASRASSPQTKEG